MQISEFQHWTKETDQRTQWDLLTPPQLVCHLTEEIGEVAQVINRISAYTEGEARENQRTNLALELAFALTVSTLPTVVVTFPAPGFVLPGRR